MERELGNMGRDALWGAAAAAAGNSLQVSSPFFSCFKEETACLFLNSSLNCAFPLHDAISFLLPRLSPLLSSSSTTTN